MSLRRAGTLTNSVKVVEDPTTYSTEPLTLSLPRYRNFVSIHFDIGGIQCFGNISHHHTGSSFAAHFSNIYTSKVTALSHHHVLSHSPPPIDATYIFPIIQRQPIEDSISAFSHQLIETHYITVLIDRAETLYAKHTLDVLCEKFIRSVEFVTSIFGFPPTSLRRTSPTYLHTNLNSFQYKHAPT